jgi:hypothetical protein
MTPTPSPFAHLDPLPPRRRRTAPPANQKVHVAMVAFVDAKAAVVAGAGDVPGLWKHLYHALFELIDAEREARQG